MRYRTIVVDPPWPLHERSGGRKNHAKPMGGWKQGNSVPLPYPTMTLPQIQALPIADLAEREAHLYVWTFNAFVPDTYELLGGWGFRPVKLLTWAKTPRGLWTGGAFTNTTEFVLFAKRGNLPNTGRVNTSWWNWKRPEIGTGPLHSRKPDGFLDVVEEVSPGPYLELFARRQRLGWDTWGNEALEHVELSA